MNRGKWIILAAALVGALSLGCVALAQASWKTVGKAWGQGDGPWVESDTQARNVKWVRFEVRTNKFNAKIRGVWRVTCDDGKSFWSRRARYRSGAPIIRELRVGIPTPNKCDLHSWAYHTTQKSSRLSLTIQKR